MHIKVTATVSFDYDTEEGIVLSEDDAHADVIDMLGNGDLSPDDFTITTSTDEEYPKTLLTVSIASYKDDGCCYTLAYPDGKQVTLGDAEDNYSELAGIIDDEYEKA